MKKKTIRLTVTADDIKKGMRGNPFSCPIALSIKRKIPDLKVAVWSNSFGDRYSFKVFGMLTLDAYQFRSDFDNGRTVEPFSFDAELI